MWLYATSPTRDFEALGVGLRVIAALVGFVVCGLSSSVSIGVACSNNGLRTGRSAELPDCRAYEQVSPREKAGFAGDAPDSSARVSPSGGQIAYLTNNAFPGAAGNTALFAAHVSERSGAGWTTTEWSPAVTQPAALKAYLIGYVFSEDLSQGILKASVVPLAPGATPNAYNLYLRKADGSLSLINTALPAASTESICGASLLWLCFQAFDLSAFAGASADLSHVAFEANGKLTPDAPEPFAEALYESYAGHVKLVGILPDGQPAETSTAGAGSAAGYIGERTADSRVENAVSSDGSKIVFQALADGGEPYAAQKEMTEVYDRINGAETIELSTPTPGATPAVNTAEPATFWAASKDGSRVFFTSSAELTTESNTGAANGGEDLYEYNVETRQLADLTVDRSPEDKANGAMVQGVVDIASDGSYVYFVANGTLDSSNGIDGQPNLYVVHDGGRPTFIATLSSSGPCDLSNNHPRDACDWTPFPQELEADISPDGRHLAFMSTMKLPTSSFPTGYDNTDETTGEPDRVVYEYSVATEGKEGQIVCASCSPDGTPPAGDALLGGIANEEAQPHAGIRKEASISTPFYRVQAVSDDGERVFYTEPTSQTARFERVFEYEWDGEGTCATSGGCHYSVSSGGGESDQFLGASADGGDVFFVTANSLADTDQDASKDVYDARVGGGIETQLESVCEQRCRPQGVPPVFEPSASSSSSASGNLPSSANSKRIKKCHKGYSLRRGRCVKRKKATHKAARSHSTKGRTL